MLGAIMSKNHKGHDSEISPEAPSIEPVEHAIDTQDEMFAVADVDSPNADSSVDFMIVDSDPAAESPKEQSVEASSQNIVVSGEGVAFGQIRGDVHIYRPDRELAEARALFTDSLRHRDQFVGKFLKQALQQSDTTFRLSVFFMTMGGLIVLGAAILAVTRFVGSPSQGIALVSGIGGILIGTSGAAFSLRADKARKHLASQASMMHSQLLDERRFTQIVDLLAGIKDPQLNDQARVSLAMRLMGEALTTEATTSKEVDPGLSRSNRQRERRRQKPRS
jgi:hypothetical protein